MTPPPSNNTQQGRGGKNPRLVSRPVATRWLIAWLCLIASIPPPQQQVAGVHLHGRVPSPATVVAASAQTSASGAAAAAGAAQRELQYVVREEAPPDTFVGDVAKDAGLYEKYGTGIVRKLRFSFLNHPTIGGDEAGGGGLAFQNGTGVILTRGRIDRETACARDEDVCKIRLDIAVQPMAYFQIIKAAVEILDVNDNAPVFDPARRTYELVESAPSSAGTAAAAAAATATATAAGLAAAGLAVPAAFDADSAQFSVVRYQLQAASSHHHHHHIVPSFVNHYHHQQPFELRTAKKPDGSTDVRLVLARPLDREVQDVHHLRVVAVDGGAPPRSGTIDVTVIVLDANDNAPVFDRETYDASITENDVAGAEVVRVHASDADLGANADVTYALGAAAQAQYGDVFAVDRKSGVVRVVGAVDYETTPVYHLMVTAADGGQPEAMTVDAMVVIRVLDVNDNAPQITVNTLATSDARSAAVPEDADVGTFVAHVIARDPDAGRQSNCMLTNGSGEGVFALQRMFDMEYQVTSLRCILSSVPTR